MCRSTIEIIKIMLHENKNLTEQYRTKNQSVSSKKYWKGEKYRIKGCKFKSGCKWEDHRYPAWDLKHN